MERHEPDLTSLIAGLLFVALGAAFLLDRVGAVDLNIGVVWPLALIALGIAGLLRSLPTGRGDENRRSDGGLA